MEFMSEGRGVVQLTDSKHVLSIFTHEKSLYVYVKIFLFRKGKIKGTIRP
jgi:hypothetical protein